MDSPTVQVATDCLRVSVILRTILQHFSTRELLQLSLVNKFWSYEARSLLRDRGMLALAINSFKTRGPHSCQDLRVLASSLKRTKEITRALPFSGLTIDLNGSDWTHTDWCTESSSTELSEVYDDILCQITWKSLAVEFGNKWTEEFTNSSGFLLVKKLLEKFGSVLEKLELTFPPERGEILEQVFQSCSFPRLAILEIYKSYAPNDGYTSWIKTIVSRAPNLKLLDTANYVDLNGNLLEGSSAVHVADYLFSPLRNEIPESVVGPRFQMTRMDLRGISKDFQLDRFNRITSGILEASRTSMSRVYIDVMFLVPLAIYGVCLENATHLEIYLNENEVDNELADLWRLAKSFDFTRIFPALKKARVHCYSDVEYTLDGIPEMVERANASFVQPMPDRAVNIKKLIVDGCWEIYDSGEEFLVETFPDVEELSFEGSDIPFGRIWESWPRLKALDVNCKPNVFKNLDSDFCGVFPEEVAELRKQDEEYLQRVHIVPVMPSITCQKNLKTLNFTFGESSHGESRPVNDPTQWFSKVTGLIAFQRCPALAVTLTMEDERHQDALSHLRPYATVVLKAPDSIRYQVESE